jgi:protein TonB
MKYRKLITGLISVCIYIFLVGILVLYFNLKSKSKSHRYVKKDEHTIQISIASLQKPIVTKKKKKDTNKQTVTKRKKKKIKYQKHLKKKSIHKKYIKQKKIAKKKDRNITKKVKNLDTKSLFTDIKVTQKAPKIKITDKPIVAKPKYNIIHLSDKKVSAIDKINNSLKKQPNKNSGIKNEYLARVQEALEDWPTQSDFAGESVKVLLYIKPSGYFTFKIKSASKNKRFNESLKEYLEQLQSIGFGRHRGNKTYIFEANFVAKE